MPGMVKRMSQIFADLFVFLDRPDVEPTNHVAERALRSSVTHRKVIGCYRSGWGAKVYADLASVNDRAELFGTPSFSVLAGGE